MSAGIKANVDGSAAIQVGGTDVITLTSGGAATFVTSPTTVQAGTAAAPSITFSGDTNTGIYSPGADTIAFAEGGAEVARFDSAGNFGLGATPSAWGGGVFKVLQLGGGGSNVSAASGTDEQIQVVSNGYYDGSAYRYVISAHASRYVQNNGVHQWDTAPSGTAGNAITFTQAMTLDASGNLGIGTSSPGMRLDVQAVNGIGSITSTTGTNTVNWRLTNTGGTLFMGIDSSTGGNFTGDAYAGVLWHSGNYPLVFATNNSQRARITSDGNLLVGATSSGQTTERLYVSGSVESGGAGVVGFLNSNNNANADSSPPLVIHKTRSTTTSSARFLQFYAGGVANQPMGGIVGNGAQNVQFATLSDVREKTNIQPISGSLDKVVSLRPVSFDWIKSSERVNAGFIAQEVEQIFPEFVVENMANEGEEARKGLSGGMTGGIVAHLVKAIQEQQAMIDELKAKVAALEGA